jgi:hypothetical protein
LNKSNFAIALHHNLHFIYRCCRIFAREWANARRNGTPGELVARRENAKLCEGGSHRTNLPFYFFLGVILPLAALADAGGTKGSSRSDILNLRSTSLTALSFFCCTASRLCTRNTVNTQHSEAALPKQNYNARAHLLLYHGQPWLQLGIT